MISESRKPKNPAQGEYEDELDSSGIRMALEGLGPAYVKLGQLLCTGPDLVGNDIGEALQRFSKKLVVNKFNPVNVAKGSYDYLLDVEHLMKDLPDRINSTLTKVEKGEIKVNLELAGLTELKNQLSASLIISALIIGSSLAILSNSGPKMWDTSAIGLFGPILSKNVYLFTIFNK